jgi:hypothetical protein
MSKKSASRVAPRVPVTREAVARTMKAVARSSIEPIWNAVRVEDVRAFFGATSALASCTRWRAIFRDEGANARAATEAASGPTQAAA